MIYASWLWAIVAGAVAWRSNSGLCLVLALVVCLAACVAIPIVFGAGHPVPLWGLNRVRVGMNEHQVKSALGRPTSIDGTTWAYSSDWTFCYVTIAFSDSGKVREVVHDH